MSIAVARSTPANRITFATQTMNRQRRAGQNVRLAGRNELAARQHFQLAQARLIPARRHAAHRGDVADQHDPLRRLGPDHRLDDGRRQMMPIDDQAGRPVGRRRADPRCNSDGGGSSDAHRCPGACSSAPRHRPRP